MFTPEMSLQDKVSLVRAKAVVICGYLPKPASVEAMLLASSGSVVITGVNELAQAICTAVTVWEGKKGTGEAFVTICPRVNGVCVEGEFTEKGK